MPLRRTATVGQCLLLASHQCIHDRCHRHHRHKPTTEQWLRLPVVLALLATTIYAVTIVLLRYVAFETIISLDRQPPSLITFPGITVCAPAIFSPAHLAQLYPGFNESYFRFRHDGQYSSPFSSSSSSSSDERIRLFRRYESKALQHYSALEVITAQSLAPGDLLDRCRYWPVNIRNVHPRSNHSSKAIAIDCLAVKPLVATIYDGRKCFTYFSNFVPLLPQANERGKKEDDEEEEEKKEDEEEEQNDITMQQLHTQMNFDLNPSIELRVKMNSDLWDYLGEESRSIIFTVHPPHLLPAKRDFQFYRVTKNSFYEVHFTKRITKLLPPPYKTRCTNYSTTSSGHSNGKPSLATFRTSAECRSVCIKEYAYEHGATCASYFAVLSSIRMFDPSTRSKEKICDHEHQNHTLYLAAQAHCAQRCRPECVQSLFEITGRVETYLDDSCDYLRETEAVEKNDTADDEAVVVVVEEEEEEKEEEKEEEEEEEEDEEEEEALAQKQTGKDDAKLPNHSLKQHRDCNLTRIVVRIAATPFELVVHQPSFTFSECLGTLGGHLGIWLGLSLFSLINYTGHRVFAGFMQLLRLYIHFRRRVIYHYGQKGEGEGEDDDDDDDGHKDKDEEERVENHQKHSQFRF